MRNKSALTLLSISAVLALACNETEVQAATPVAATPVAAPTTAIAQIAAMPAGAANAAVPTGAPAKRKSNKQYTVLVRPVLLKVGGKTVVKLVIQPNKGLKFNKDFPSKFIVSGADHAACDKKKLTKRGGDVTIDGKKGLVSIPLTARAAGTGTLSIIGNFSVCNDEQCYVLRGERLALNVTVR